MVGMFATSKAGHDKDTVYIIIREEGQNVFLSDGRLKPVSAPKRKNKKHIQIIKQQCEESLFDRIRAQEPINDEEIKRAVKLYRRSICQKLM